MNKYLMVAKEAETSELQVRNWGFLCKQEKWPCVIIYTKNNFAEITCDNWHREEDGILPMAERQKIDADLKALLQPYPEYKPDVFVSEFRQANQLLPNRLWYTFIHVPVGSPGTELEFAL